MPKKTKLSDMSEHLFEMAERLLDDEVCVDEQAIDKEVKKASALVNIANTVVGIQQMEVTKAETEIKMSRLADYLGETYIPEKIVSQKKQIELENSKKKLLTEQLN